MSRTHLQFVPADPSHQAGLARFFHDLIAAGDTRFFHPHPFTADEARQICHYQGADLYALAHTGDDVLAYGMLRGWAEGYEIPSLGIAVHPRGRGTGLARAFMTYLHAAARLRGAKKVRLKVYPDNVRAQRLYQGLGYHFDSTSAGQLVGHCLLQGPDEGHKAA
jgi:ribosomal protein S18 acetylase RimI-like enzyme